MQDFWFYIKLGFNHVLDLGAYDHILFLAALAVPFAFKSWKQVVVLATIFTITHCVSLALSVYGVATVDVGLIEFLIPITIAAAAIFNGFYIVNEKNRVEIGFYFHCLVTAFFGLIHGFGFSNYFKMLMAEEEEKVGPLLGFCHGNRAFTGGHHSNGAAISFCIARCTKGQKKNFYRPGLHFDTTHHNTNAYRNVSVLGISLISSELGCGGF